jgi:hypothetical protein
MVAAAGPVAPPFIARIKVAGFMLKLLGLVALREDGSRHDVQGQRRGPWQGRRMDQMIGGDFEIGLANLKALTGASG